jgi:formylglycine-generating enzyme required for sulfatase activity
MGKNWAIAVGIDRYDNLKDLSYARRDAEAMRDFFGAELGFEQVYFFAQGAPPIPADQGKPLPAEPTFARLNNFLDRRFKQAWLEPGDNLWFFFSGHGKRDAQRDYLMLEDSNPENVAGSALAIQELAARLRQSGAGNVILLLDACRDDASRGGLGVGLPQQGVITFYSCGAEQESFEIAELGGGAFTYALLQGLQLRGETGNCATVERLYAHVRNQVPALVERYKGRAQHPMLALDPESKRDAILLPGQARPSDVMALKNHALKCEVKGDRTSARNFWIQVLAVGLDLEAIEALERLAQGGYQTPIGPGLDSGQSRSAVNSAPPKPTSPSPKPPSIAYKLKTFRFETVQLSPQGAIIQNETRTGQYFVLRLKPKKKLLGVSSEGAVDLKMVQIPGGKFIMGSPKSEPQRFSAEGPQHEVTVPSFFMAQTPITQAQWRVIAAEPKVNIDLHPNPSKFKGDNRPVEQVSWLAAVEFCDRLSQKLGVQYRLPSEAEWEYACRAGTQTPFYFGEILTPNVANYNGDYTYGGGPKGKNRGETTDVLTFPANGWGLYDMHGNVREWCADHWHNNYNQAPTDGTAWKTNQKDAIRLLRGGSWFGYPEDCRSAYRYLITRDYRSFYFGFRVSCAAARTL